jgi:hypothetical protein
MRTPVVKRQTPPKSGFFPIFSAGIQAECRSPLATCSVFIAVCWRTDMAAPHTYGGSLVAVTTSVETALSSLYALETSLYPHTALCKGEHARNPFSSSCQGRGRGSTRGPCATLAAENRAGADVQARGPAWGVRPRCSCAVTTQCLRHCHAPSSGLSQARPVRRQAHPPRSCLTLEQPLYIERRFVL